ncbi:MAG: ABC transporter ATP-binding protein [Candidatus Woesearchaeota archaeon]
MNAIEVKNLYKSFYHRGKVVKAVDGISFNVKQGEILGFLGPNGAGKSTTISMLTGLIEKDSGNISILGKDSKKDWEYVRSNVNVAAAHEKLSDILTVKQNLRVFGKLYGVKKVDTKINELLDMFGIKHLINRKAIKLSSGEQTRLVLAKAMINDPKVIFMDECTVGLDPDVAERTRQIIKDYNKNTGCSILFTSHYMYEVEELCKRIVFMNDGKIIKVGSPREIQKTMTNQIIELDSVKNKPRLMRLLKTHKIEAINLDNDLIRFEIDTNNHNLRYVLNLLSKEKIDFKDLHIKKPSLNDFFIKISRENNNKK